MVDAVIFVRPENYGVSAARCLEHCAARHYNVVGIVQGDWPAARRMLDDGLAAVVVVSSPDQLDPHLEPRIEVAPKPRRQRRSSSSAVYPQRRQNPENPGAFRSSPRTGAPAVPATGEPARTGAVARPVPRNVFRGFRG